MKSLLIILCLFFSIGNTNIGFCEPSIYVESLEDAIAISQNTDLKILIIFGAEWCVFCEKTKEDISENIKEYENIIIVYVNIDKRQDLKKEYMVRKIPDYILLKKQKELKRNVGYLNTKQLLKFINDTN